MARKVILDVDPGIDDAMVLCQALTHPRLEVLAVTAVGGNVAPAQATRNTQAIIEQIDPPRWPRLGSASLPDQGLPVDGRHVHGVDGLGGADFPFAELHHVHPSEKVICDVVREHPPGAVSIIALGPLTNIARVFQRDPELGQALGELIMINGTVSGPGNITPAAEFNMYCDPSAAQMVFRSPCTKSLVPLDVTGQVVLSYDLLNRLPDEGTRVGRILHRILPPAFRAYRQRFGLEGIHVHDTVALMSVLEPELFELEEMAGEVETMGELTCGMTVFDRRRVPAWRKNIGVACAMKTDAVVEAIINGLTAAAQRAG